AMETGTRIFDGFEVVIGPDIRHEEVKSERPYRDIAGVGERQRVRHLIARSGRCRPVDVDLHDGEAVDGDGRGGAVVDCLLGVVELDGVGDAAADVTGDE